MPESLALGDPAFDPQLAEHAVASFATSANITLHVELVRGRNVHHIIEATFKGLARPCVTRFASTTSVGSRRRRACCEERVVTRPLLAVLDYGIGNLHSAQKSLEHEGADARLTADPALIADADGVVLPGVGAFGACIERTCAPPGSRDRPTTPWPRADRFSGSVVGMQMLFTKSQENEDAAGLDVIPGTVTSIPAGPKIPQMQWNRLDIVDPAEPMLRDLGDEPYVYFVHSLHGVPDDPGVVAATVEYGTTLNAAFRRDNVFAVQFHPEKSSRPGLRLLRNFVAECSR